MPKVSPAPVEESTSIRRQSTATAGTNGGRSLVVSQEEINEKINKEVKKREDEIRAKLEIEIEAEMSKKYEGTWQGKVDLEMEKNDTWSARIKGADDRAKLAERKLFICEEKIEHQTNEYKLKLKSIEDNNSEMKRKYEESEKLMKEMKEAEHDSNLRISNLENQLSMQSERAETLEQSYASELDKSEKQAAMHQQEIQKLRNEIENKARKVEEVENKHEELHKERKSMVLIARKDESSKLLFGFVSARMRRAVVISMAKWKLYRLDHHHSEKNSNMISNHHHEVNSLRKNKEDELLKNNNEAAQLRLNYEAIIRGLTQELQKMESALVEVARPQVGGAPTFNRSLALKRCNFG